MLSLGHCIKTRTENKKVMNPAEFSSFQMHSERGENYQRQMINVGIFGQGSLSFKFDNLGQERS